MPTVDRSPTPSLFDGHGDGEGATKDKRLTRQIVKVYEQLLDGDWWTLSALSQVTHAPEASVSARIRDLRKPRFGGFTIEERHIGGGLHEYHLEWESGNHAYVYEPAPEPRSAKSEARKRITEYLEAAEKSNGYGFPIDYCDGVPLYAEDLREMLR